MWAGQALSMGVHESQSLLWERMVALSLPFSRYLAPKLTAAFPQLADLQVRGDLRRILGDKFRFQVSFAFSDFSRCLVPELTGRRSPSSLICRRADVQRSFGIWTLVDLHMMQSASCSTLLSPLKAVSSPYMNPPWFASPGGTCLWSVIMPCRWLF